MNEQENDIESSYNVYGRNSGYDSAIQIRLDTVKIIENIEIFLRGLEIQFKTDQKTGVITQTQKSTGKPLLNESGVRSILNWVQLLINPQVVQGNWVIDNKNRSSYYDNFIADARTDLTKFIIVKCDDWEVMDEDIEGIIDSIMNIIEPYLSRLIDNKERESYIPTIKSIESNTMREQTQAKGFSLFNKG